MGAELKYCGRDPSVATFDSMSFCAMIIFLHRKITPWYEYIQGEVGYICFCQKLTR